MHPSSLSLVCTLILLTATNGADLSSDREALLEFAAAVPHSRILKWKNTSSNSICRSWVGVSCSSDGTSSRVTALRLPGSGFLGSIPDNTLGRLDALITLSLRSNFLSGSIPADVLSLPSLRYINLQFNNFSGEIPNSLMSPQLNVIDFSFNSLSGGIPDTIQNLTLLNSLYLQNNSLSGRIPPNLPNLKQLNLSNNYLNGSIPSDLQSFPASSFSGNSMLCGKPLNECVIPLIPPSPSPSINHPLPSPSINHPSPSPTITPITHTPEQKGKKRSLSKSTIIGIGVGGASVILFCLALALMLKKKRAAVGGEGIVKRKTSEEEFGSGVQNGEKKRLVFFEGCSYSFNLEDLLRASAEVLGKGSYGTTYSALLEEGTTVVVKRLREVFAGKREFEQQMKAIAITSKQHPNIVALRAYYYSKDEKLLVYDHLPAPTLYTILHGNRESGRTTLDWESRVKISLGVARGVAHIHSSASGFKMTHGNIKSSNVLLTQDFSDARITDFGFTPLMGLQPPPTVQPRTPAAAGYRAPELIATRKSTQKSDVYSFGVLLLELLTGKAPAQSSSGQDDVAVDLPRWVQSVVREEWTAEVFDAELIRYPNAEEEMVQMLQIALACVAKVPDMRPAMDQVVAMIQEIHQRSDSPENQQSSDTPRGPP